MRRPRKKSLEEVFPQGFHYTKDEFFNPPQQGASILLFLLTSRSEVLISLERR